MAVLLKVWVTTQTWFMKALLVHCRNLAEKCIF